MIDPEIINKVLKIYEEEPDADYIFIEDYPRGLGDIELISSKALKTSFEETNPDQTYYREHVMTYITDNPSKFNIHIEKAPLDMQKDYRLCIDESDDFEVVRKVYENFLPNLNFNSEDIIQFLDENPEIVEINKHVKQKTV